MADGRSSRGRGGSKRSRTDQPFVNAPETRCDDCNDDLNESSYAELDGCGHKLCPYHKRSRHHWMTVSWSHIPTFTINIKQLNTEVNMRFYRWRHLPRVLYSIGIGVRTWEWSLGNIGQIELHKSQPKHLVLAFSLMNAMDTTAITSREDTDTYFATTPFWLVVWIWVVRLRWLTQQQDANNIYNKRIAWHSLQWNDMDVEKGEVKHES